MEAGIFDGSSNGNGKGTGSVVNIGDVVLVYNEGLKRGFWKVAIVERLVKGKDGVVRGASVRMVEKGRPKVLNRPLQRLYPLEIREDKSFKVGGVDEQKCEQNANWNRPRTAAALDSMWKTVAMLEP